MKKLLSVLVMSTALFFVRCNTGGEGVDEPTTGGPDPIDYPELSLKITPNRLTFDPVNPANNRISITSNAPWKVNVNTSQLQLDKTEGSAGKNSITVMEVLTEGELTFTVTTTSRGETDTAEPISEMVTINPDAAPALYAEIPSTPSNSHWIQITNKSKTVKTKQQVRNYTSLYDTVRHCPIWVAYPMHYCYTEGGYGRTDPDPWRPDPNLTADQQSTIYGSDWEDWPWSANEGKPKDNYQYWAYVGDDLKRGRGHMMASSHRGGAGQEINMQTFYPTNIAPEEHIHYPHWATVEASIVDSWICSDTLYVVQGTYFGDTDQWTMDASYLSVPSAHSKRCALPEARYTVLLRTKQGNTGEPVWECDASELIAIGFWFPQVMNSSERITGTDTTPLSQFTFSVQQIEEKLGGETKFFPSVPDAVKQSYRSSDWAGL